MTCKACPFAFSDESEYVQGLGCLPSPYEILQLLKKDYNWGCHENDKLCSGMVQYVSRHNKDDYEFGLSKIKFDKNNPIVTLDDWNKGVFDAILQQ